MSSCLIDKLDKLTVLVIKTSFKKIALITPNDINQINYAYIFTSSLLTCAPYLFDKLNSDNDLLNDSKYQYYRQNVNLSEIEEIYKKYSEESKKFYGGSGGDDSDEDNESKNLLWWWLFDSVEDSFVDLLGKQKPKPTPVEKQTISERFLVMMMMFNVIIAGPAQRIQEGKDALSDANIRRLYDLNTGRGIKQKSYFSAQPQELDIKFEPQVPNGSGHLLQAQPQPDSDSPLVWLATPIPVDSWFSGNVLGDVTKAKGKEKLSRNEKTKILQKALNAREALENVHGFCGHAASLYLGAPLDHIAYQVEVSANRTIGDIKMRQNAKYDKFPDRGTWLGEFNSEYLVAYKDVHRQKQYLMQGAESDTDMFRRAASDSWNNALTEQLVKNGEYLFLKVGFEGHARVMIVTERNSAILYGFADLNYLGDVMVAQTCNDLGLTGKDDLCKVWRQDHSLFTTEPGLIPQTVFASMPRGSIFETENPQIHTCADLYVDVYKIDKKSAENKCSSGIKTSGFFLETIPYSDSQQIMQSALTGAGGLSVSEDRLIAFSEIVKTQSSRIIAVMRSNSLSAALYKNDDSWKGWPNTKPNSKWSKLPTEPSLLPSYTSPTSKPPPGWKKFRDLAYTNPTNGEIWAGTVNPGGHIYWKEIHSDYTVPKLTDKEFAAKFYPNDYGAKPSHHGFFSVPSERTETPLELSLETFLQVRQGGERPVLIIPDGVYFEALDEPGEPVLEESQPTVGLSRSVSAPVGTAEDLPVGISRSQSIGGKFKITKRRRFKTIKKTKRNNKKQKKTRRRRV
jgi:hypothetical protein